MNFRHFLSYVTVLIACVGCTATSDRVTSAKPAGLVIGVQAVKPDETRAAWLPLITDLSVKAGAPIQLLTGSQTETVQALAAGKVDVAWLSSSVAIDAVVDANAQAIALYHNVNGTNGYKAVIVVRSDSGIRTLDEALTPGKYRYAAGARTSTSGYVLPQHFLFGPRKTTAEGLFKSVLYGGHFQNLEALWAKQVDVIVNNTTDLGVFQERTPGAKEGLQVLWESPLVPNDVLMVRADMPAAIRKQLANLFLGYGRTPQEKELFRRASGISHFVPADNRLLEPVSGFKFATERAQIEQDVQATPAQKAQRLATLQERAARFGRSVQGAGR